MGVDGPAADGSRDRIFTFTSDSAGIVRASAEADGSDDIRLCLGRGALGSVTAEQCQESTEPMVTSAASGAATTWTVTLSGLEGTGGMVDVALMFPSEAPSLSIDGFRFQGTAFDAYNGFLAEVLVSGAGDLTVQAAWTGGSVPYRLSVSEEGGTIGDESGDGSEISSSVPVTGGPHRIRLTNQQEFAEQDHTLQATLTWP